LLKLQLVNCHYPLPSIHSILKQYWGFDTFRPLQETIIHSVLDGKDTLALMPTGGGKSICFQVPALMKDGICLVITPLIALMKDQVSKLQQLGIPSLAVYSGMQFKEIQKILDNAVYGNFKFLYVSPERLQSDFFREYLPHLQLSLLAVDEAHCISQWGYDFRPAYLKIAEVREEKPDIPLLALTATATKKVRDDIQQKLLFRKQNVLLKSFARNNLSYSVFCEQGKFNKLVDILQKVAGSSIIYCRSRRRTTEIASMLQAHGFAADYYHAGLSSEERDQKQEAWIQSQVRIIVCTNAFGMGIDKPDVRLVIHYDMPDSPEAYYQEAGRAGRDEEKAYAVLLYEEHELTDFKTQLDWKFPSLTIIRSVYQSIVNYLQLPAGVGEGQYHDFDIADFAKTFQIKISLVYAIVKILEQESLLQFSETIFLPSRVLVNSGREELFHFEENFSNLDPLIKCLLRTYEGIFDTYVSISEKQLSRLLHWPEEDIRKGLQQLQQYRIIEYFPQKAAPQIYFIQNRSSSGQLKINMQHLEQRKAAYENRLDTMISYVRDKRCRSQQLLNYFDEPDSVVCGICDVCLEKKKEQTSMSDFNQISRTILDQIKQPIDLATLLRQFSPISPDKVQEVVHFLLSEGKIKMNEKGEVILS
jgi:ATP-dependent DNA helicase RecQ